jgi:hypothetical protein
MQYRPTGEWKLSDLLEHPDVDFGFVVSVNGNVAFVRFWSRANNFAELRTKANSELVPQANLFGYKLKPPELIVELLESL